MQDDVRKRQALLFSATITLLCLSLWIFFLHQNRLGKVNDGMSTLTTQLIIAFNDNELIADAVGVRYQQLHSSGDCGSMSDYTQLSDSVWAINGDKSHLDPAAGTLISRTRSPEGRCMYEAGEFIRQKTNTLNPGDINVHRYIIARDTGWLYWFISRDSAHFSFDDSAMAKNPAAFFKPPTSFYDRVLQKDIGVKADSATNFYDDKITGERGYSIVSYVYDLSQKAVSNKIVGYLLYDHSAGELRQSLKSAFGGELPPGLMLGIHNLPTNETLCLTQSCEWINPPQTRHLSHRYQFRFVLPVYLMAIRDPAALMAILLSPLLFLLITFLLRRRLNAHDIQIYTDPLTGSFTRNIMDFVRNRQGEYSAVILMDCNKFKSINDTWGHSSGDRALQVIAHQMMLNVRAEKDLVIRSGGDEFVILLRQTPLEEAKSIALRVAARIADSDFRIGETRIPLSVSWGISPFLDDLDTAIQHADLDMYRMKNLLRQASEKR